MSLPVMEYDYDAMKLDCIYKDEDYIDEKLLLESKQFLNVYGNPLYYSVESDEFPYLYSSVVTSMDGKIAFNDKPIGPLISRMNKLDQDGATADWWMLNALRASSDAIMFGANTLVNEPDTTGHVYDQSLMDERVDQGKNPVPVNIIPSIDALDIPFNHIEFTSNLIPVIIYTCKKGYENLTQMDTKDIVVIEKGMTVEEFKTDVLYVISTGDTLPDHREGMRALKSIGLNKILVESPTITHLLVQDQLMNEMFINQSGIYLGGDSLTIGSDFKGFETNQYPHTSLVSMHLHSKHFLYTRYKLIYKQGE
jgi:riboflavin biosynthesis pyrimidine reductase